ncbi:hypothetical protein CAPTEDRAFT_202808 [Capitella teleta]|uniref:Receptor ligand binding region domain-containing protein n=1 Tax=Capitella teleta TaxID=283909 RepID=R7URP6_CAPTE|nr:hypothetical protein CAPTEDRAFT_202808 [Capitella teleta]|eukprot:ELU09194.1 hypothetical protein CAPTEDRAFT_202808 [Capitella teleta]
MEINDLFNQFLFHCKCIDVRGHAYWSQNTESRFHQTTETTKFQKSAAAMLYWPVFIMSICSLTTGAISSVMSQYSKNLTWPQHFKIGLLAPWNASFDDYSALTSASAVSIAIEAIQKDPTLSDKMVFSVVTKDSGCLSKKAAGNAVKLFIEDNIDVFIGPPCSTACRPAAELASYWNKPIISWVATDPDFNDRKTFSTLGRILGPFSKMGSFMLEVFKQYNWKRVVVISSNYFVWSDAGRAIRMVFEQNNVTIAYSSDFDRLPPTSYITRVLLKAKEEGRIIILVVPKEDRRRFMLRAHDLGMTKGEFVFYTIELLPDENVLNPEDVWAGNDERDRQAMQAFQAVFHVTLAALSNSEVNEFRKEVARRMRLPPWNEYVSKYVDVWEMLDFPMGDKYSPFLYDAIRLYAISLNETIVKGMDFRSGEDIQANMKAKVFDGMTGRIVLDDIADREPDYWITDMSPNGTFIRIAEVLNGDLGERVSY